MPKEILFQIIKEKLIFDFIIIIIVYSMVELIIFKLNLQIAGAKAKLQTILLGILPLIFYDILAKTIFPGLIYILVYIILLTIITKIVIKIELSWTKIFWSSFLSLFISSIGVLAIEIPISLHPPIARFITKTPPGVACGAICELTFPLIAYFILKTIDISLIPSTKRKISILDAANLAGFALPFLLLYNAFLRTLKYLDIYSKWDLIKDMLYEWLIVGLEVGIYRFIYISNKKQFELQQENIELQQKKLKQSEETISELKIHNEKLTEFNKYLKNRKTTPQKILDDVANLISSNRNITLRLEEFHKSLSNQSESGDIFEYDFITEMAFNELELKIIERIVEGETNAEIANALGLSTGRVRNIITELLNKTGSRDRTVLAVRYIKSKSRK
ncbi:MAG: LuxR C-terminal-related transcriptional regulator [Firmicutes bacterium]|nr:LuxR C-terminal-related transcriptional regulator [Bacillota bacterium]